MGVVEAGLGGLPIVGTSVGGVPEIISSNEDGLLIPAGDATKLANALETLLSDAEMRERFGKKIKEKIISNFSEAGMLEATEQVYLRLFRTS